MQSEFELFVVRVRSQVEGRLGSWLDARVDEARGRGPEVESVADAVRQLALRGGKRMRAALLAAAYEACGGQGGSEVVAYAGVSLELLQAYLLIHDDWMDGDETRRGGPSVPALMRARFANGNADAMAVLAGDLAAAWARRALFDVPLPPDRLVAAATELALVEEEVVEGQVLDVAGGASDATAVEAMHTLKTSSYTVRGPLVMGALLAAAPNGDVAAIKSLSRPLGVAFQLRDDVLGVFGDSRATGKPAGADLLAGKRSAVVVAALAAGLRGELAPVLGQAHASASAVRAAIELLEARGVRARVEDRIGALAREASAALERATLTARGRAILSGAIVALTHRQT
jgi:geranylgeranyl diphosphate synthase type I